MKWILCAFILLVSLIGRSQDVFRFRVKGTLSRTKSENGGWNEWQEIGDINRKISQQFLFNLTGRKLVWTIKYEKQPPSIHTYTIIDVDQDTAYKDFGIWELKIDAKEGNNEIQQFKVLFIENTSQTSYMLITGSNIFQSKYALEYEE
jgi:hypothetical protein